MSEKYDPEFLRLWDLYSPLLTPSQREITDLYFNYDLSLGEIAEQKGVSRQSVSDCLNKSRKQLESYDQKLGMRELLEKGDRAFSAYMTSVNRWIQAQREAHPEYGAELSALKNALDDVLRESGVDVLE